jgi:hypothetical protein
MQSANYFNCAGPGEGAERREYSGSRGAESLTFLKVYSQLNVIKTDPKCVEQ